MAKPEPRVRAVFTSKPLGQSLAVFYAISAHQKIEQKPDDHNAKLLIFSD